MARKRIGLLALLICLVGLSGCVFSSVEEMYALPKSSEAYVNLQAKINAEKGNAEYIAPLSGENRQTIQLVDVDGDGIQEAVAFFRDANAEAPLKIVFFRQDDRGEYQTWARIEGVGTEIESIDYLELCEPAGCEILVSWQVNASVRDLVGYAIKDGQPVEILRSSYVSYLSADLDQDGQEELVLAQTGADSLTGWEVEYYDGIQGRMELLSATPLSLGATEINTWTAGMLADEVPALFVTSCFGKDDLITDVFCLGDQGLENIALHGGSHQSKDTYHYYAGVHPADMNGDGITEVPVAQSIPAYGTSTASEFWWLHWMAYQSDGASTQVLTTYHSGDGWYLEIPDEWTGAFSMCRQENSATGVRNVLFARGVELAEEEEDEGEDEENVTNAQPQAFLAISTLMGADRGELAQLGQRFTLASDSTTIFAGEFFETWDCGLDEDTLRQRFHQNAGTWSYSH
ncbi:MAG: hypothetical protein J6K94_02020 [Ruminiclostridium sp.]|nr:hypothetical protein [Ruminiclostridium sp.]